MTVTVDQMLMLHERLASTRPGHERDAIQPQIDATDAQIDRVEQQPKDPRAVFVVHGRDDNAREAMFTFLRAVGLEPLEFNVAIQATGKPMPYIGEILDSAFGLAQAVVVLMTPDDEARLQPRFLHNVDPPHERNLTSQARPNVLFEAGMAMGRCPDRTIIVEIGTLRGLSDISGLHTIRMNDTSQRRQELAQRLIAAGCPANLDETDWHNAGRFASE
jgi:predicted nucleotide-binding protein